MRVFLDRFVGNISPAALLVSTFFWSWFDLVPFSPLLFASAGAPETPLPLVVSLPLSALALVACAGAKGLGEHAVSPRAFAASSLVLGAGGSLLVYAGAVLSSMMALVVGGALIGLYQGLGVVVVGGLIVCQGKTNALIHISACLPFNVVFVLLGMFLQPGAAVVLCVALPLLSALSFAVYLERGSNSQVFARVLEAPRPPTGRASRGMGAGASYGAVASGLRRYGVAERVGCVALLLVITVAFGFVNCRTLFGGEVQGSPYLDYISLFVRALAALLVMGAYVFWSWQPRSLLVAAVVLMFVGLSALGFAPVAGLSFDSAGNVLVCAGYAVFDLLIWAIIVIVHRGSNLSILRFTCAVYAIDQLGLGLGTAVGLMTREASLASLVCGVLGVGLMLLAFLVVGVSAALREGLDGAVIDLGDAADEAARGVGHDAHADEADAVRSRMTPGAATRAGRTSSAGPLPGMSATLRAGGTGMTDGEAESEGALALARETSVGTVAARYFLTDREADTLALLAAGRSAPYISEQLGVSLNTVKTHARHIYAKLDVHSRQELLDLLESPAHP